MFEAHGYALRAQFPVPREDAKFLDLLNKLDKIPAK